MNEVADLSPVSPTIAEPTPRPQLTCIWLCATQGGSKAEGMKQEIEQGPFHDAAVVVSPAHLLDEAAYNHLLTQAPELIALVKVLQRARPVEMNELRPALENLLHGYGVESAMKGEVLLVANDVILQIFDGKANQWVAFNKYKPDENGRADRKAILEDWVRMLTRKNTRPGISIQLRFRCGVAAFIPHESRRRGVAGQIELHFQIDPLDEKELKDYMAYRTDKELLATNGGLDWADPKLQQHIRLISQTPREDKEFDMAYTYFYHVIKGHAPGLSDLIRQAFEFSQGMAIGDETSTVNALMDRTIADPYTKKPVSIRNFLKNRGITDTGLWNRWRPKIPV